MSNSLGGGGSACPPFFRSFERGFGGQRGLARGDLSRDRASGPLFCAFFSMPPLGEGEHDSGDQSIWRGPEGYLTLAIIAFGAFEFIVPPNASIAWKNEQGV